MMAMTVKNGIDRLRSGNQRRRALDAEMKDATKEEERVVSRGYTLLGFGAFQRVNGLGWV